MLLAIEYFDPDVLASAIRTVSNKGVKRHISPVPRPARLRQPVLTVVNKILTMS